MLALAPWAQHVLDRLHARDSTTAPNCTHQDAGEVKHELSRVLAALHEPPIPFPRQRPHFLQDLGFLLTLDVPEVDLAMRLDPGQQLQEVIMQSCFRDLNGTCDFANHWNDLLEQGTAHGGPVNYRTAGQHAQTGLYPYPLRRIILKR